ncbi:Interferon-induced GTP-binding protein Mx1 [Trichoderma lentiforme]|uniref:Interferon-induced GTP-binding protein Mx1 n=1 Tax=Trichoderma lentiforme TaxID=1567552 RepID=A0A9P4XAV2_9HYPO|nr:Interferon-induced GTP-binding protein Mx1 [Trichoderma lentiforme]
MTAQSDGEPPDGKFSHLRTSKSSQRLNQVEKIRAHGVGDLISLPALVVCGDQSTGKSSVLEGVTGIPFPRQEGLCTRFPSEINLRHTECESVTITASIRPHISRPAEVQQTLSAYRKQLKDMSELPGVIEEVSRLMNIRGYCDNENASAFSVDVLRIEVAGPIGLHLSVVDLPGLISVANEEQTEEDVEAVHSMVASYLQSSRTIILAVLQASNDMANQPIIKLARTHDPLGQRTVGIITKPDLINHGSEAKIALVAKNKDNIKLKLGFFLLKNPSPAELKECVTMAARSNLERRFFSGPAWANQNLDMSRVGAENLRIFLQDLLDTHIERELPKVREEIKKLLAERDAELRSLGEARPTTDLIRNFLTALSMRFYELLQAALDGNYHSIDTRFFSESDISRLRARVQESNTKFATYMRVSGKRRKLKIEVNRDNTEPESDDSEDDKLDDITTQLIVNKAGMMRWVKEAYARTKGKELPGNYNSALLAELFHEQSRRWPIIAESHIDTILKIVSEWIQLAVEKLIPEESMRAQVHSILQQWLEETEKNALGELEKLIKDERRSPLTYNHYYTDNVQKARLDAQKKAVENAVSAERDNHGKLHVSNVQVDIQKFIAAIGSRITVDMDEQACHEAITELDAYYKVTMKTFVDNVARQVIERHVIAPLPNAFSPNSVSQLSEEDLLRIGSESEKQIARREKLALQVQGLKKSLRDLQKSSL